jgi:hypothetical protein
LTTKSIYITDIDKLTLSERAKTLRVTPAMEAGVADRLWDIADIAKLADGAEIAPKKRGSLKSRVRFQTDPLPAHRNA